MLMYPDHPQNWMDLGRSLLNFLILAQFWLNQMRQILYLYPVLAFRSLHSLCLSVCMCVWLCVCQLWGCPCNNSSPIQVWTTTFGQKMQNTLDKFPIVLGIDWSWTSRSNLTWNTHLNWLRLFWCQNQVLMSCLSTRINTKHWLR